MHAHARHSRGRPRNHREEPRTNPFTLLSDEVNPNWTFAGTGPRGEKVDMLYRISPAVLANGYTELPKIVLQMGLFDAFRARNNIDRELLTPGDIRAVRNAVLHSPFSKGELEFLQHIFDLLPAGPLLLRSSAFGDAAGTGVYESTFFLRTGDKKKDFQAFVDGIKKVLASEFSEHAVRFRQRRDFDPGVAVFIEPVFGRHLKQDDFHRCLAQVNAFAPDLCGFGYVNRDMEGDLMLNVGLPTSVVAGKGHSFDLRHSWANTPFDLVLEGGGTALSNLMRLSDTPEVIDLSTRTIGPVHETLSDGLHYFDMKEFTPRLEQLLKDLGIKGAAYFEWAARKAHHGFEQAILQFAELRPSSDSVICSDSKGYRLVHSDTVLAQGSVSSDKLFTLTYDGNPSQLKQFNAKNTGYTLVIDSVFLSDVRDSNLLMTASLMGSGRALIMREKLPYNYFDKAGAIVICGPESAVSSVRGHLEGFLRESDVVAVFAKTNVISVRYSIQRELELGEHDPIPANVNNTVIANKREGRAIVLLDG